jgi:hypothetical protein
VNKFFFFFFFLLSVVLYQNIDILVLGHIIALHRLSYPEGPDAVCFGMFADCTNI